MFIELHSLQATFNVIVWKHQKTAKSFTQMNVG